MEAAGVWEKCKLLMRKEPEAPTVVHEDEEQVVIYDPSDMFTNPAKKRKLWIESREFNTKCKKRLVRVSSGASQSEFTLRFNDQLVALPGHVYNIARERLRSKSCRKCAHIAEAPSHLQKHARTHATKKCIKCNKMCPAAKFEKHLRSHCAAADCGERPSYGRVQASIEANPPTHCVKHADRTTMEDLRHKRCAFPGCKTRRPCYGLIGGSSTCGILCEKHADHATMENVTTKRCVFPNCKTIPCYGEINEILVPATHCKEHADLSFMEDVVHRRCVVGSCKTRPSFGPINGLGQSASHCRLHANLEVMEDVVNRRCAFPACKTKPSFGPIGGLSASASFCGLHADRDIFENVISRRCAFTACRTCVSYGPIDGAPGSATHCSIHADLTTMENVVGKRCESLGCKTAPCFGPIDGERSSAICCAEHADLDIMENVSMKRCDHNGCKTRALFYEVDGQRSAMCNKHAIENGLKPKSVVGASVVSCEFLDRLSLALNVDIEHKHLEPGKAGYSGSEHKVCSTKYRADGYIVESNVVIEFHGNVWHGYPEGHPKFDEISPLTGKRNSSMYVATMNRMHAIKALGYVVWYVWEHEYAAIRSKPLASVESILHEL